MEVQKTSNKENARPKRAEQKQVVTSFIKRPAPGKSAPLRSKNDPKDGAVEKRAEPLKKATEQQKSAVAKPPLASKKPASLSQKFLSQQSSTYKKMQTQTPKPASVAPPKAVSSVAPKPTLGTYKGKVIQSKVDCFRKPEDPATKAAEKRVFARPAVPKYTPLTPATLSRIKSRSVTTLASAKPASSTVSQTQPRRPKSVTDVPLSRPASRTTTTRGQPQTVSTTRQFQVTKRPPVTTTNRPVAPAMAGTKGVAAATTRLAKSKSTTELNQRAAKPPAPAPSSTLRPPPRKPAVSTLSHTRATMETAEERRAKLAEWLATKGKTLKRPPIHASSTTTTTQPPTQRSRPATTKPRAAAAASTAPAQKKAQPATAPEVTHQAPEPEPVVELTAPQPQSWEEQEEEEEEAAGSSGPVTSSPSPAAAAPAPGMNTTLDMLDSCALDLPEVDVEVPMHELVVNLCEALEAMEPPSTCQSNDEKEDASEQEAAEEGAEMQVEQEEVVEEEEKIEEEEEEEKVEVEEGEIKEEMADEKNESLASSTEASAEDSESGMDADSIEESESESDSLSGEDDQPDTADVTERKVKTEVKQEEEEEEEEEEDDDDDEDEKENCGPTTPECNGASVVKFSVRTTPFLQSVKKRIDDGACASPCASASAMVAPASCPPARSRKSTSATAIGELKFLTPVRRSRRIERQSARLPAALADHDPCVTSLAELARLEGGEDGVDGHGGAMMAANAYIYRRNPALLNDTHTDLTRL